MVAVCSVGKTDINARMVVLGWALAYQRYSMDYVDEKAAAMVSSRFITTSPILGRHPPATRASGFFPA